jgi:hypothetical protein
MRLQTRLALAALPLLLVGCGGGDGDTPPPPAPPAPTPPGAALNVQGCLDQVVTDTPRRTVANLFVPDTIKLDMSRPAGFPNGRRLTDSVIDTELAWLFIDVQRHGVDALARLPLGPQANDVPFRAEFPYLAPPQGNQVLPSGGSNFIFRTDPVSSYVMVDRMGMPAVATAVIGSSAKVPYNDDTPAVDGSRKYVPEIAATLTVLAQALADDFQARGFTICARPAG